MNTSKVLYLDIETVPQFENFDLLPEEWKQAWTLKAQSILQNNPEETLATSYQRAGLYAEFGKIICISTGYIKSQDGQKKIQHRSYYGDERKLLLDFANDMNEFAKKNFTLCAHNGKTFDFPYIFRRMIILGVPVPSILQVAGKKPWEIALIDTIELWKCGDFKYYTSLNLLALVLGIPSPKDDIDGSQVAKVFYEDKDIKRIVEYCVKDVVTLAKVHTRIVSLQSAQAADQMDVLYPAAT